MRTRVIHCARQPVSALLAGTTTAPLDVRLGTRIAPGSECASMRTPRLSMLTVNAPTGCERVAVSVFNQPGPAVCPSAITDHGRFLSHLKALRPAMRALRGLDVGSAPGRHGLLSPSGAMCVV